MGNLIEARVDNGAWAKSGRSYEDGSCVGAGKGEVKVGCVLDRKRMK